MGITTKDFVGGNSKRSPLGSAISAAKKNPAAALKKIGSSPGLQARLAKYPRLQTAYDRVSSRLGAGGLGGSSESGSGGGSSGGGGGGGSSGGGGGYGSSGTDPAAQITVPDELVPPDYRTIPGLPEVDLTALDDILAKTSTTLDESITNLEAANAPLLRGEIPQDVQDKLRTLASESAATSGISGQMSEARSARDFGLTSLEIKRDAMERAGSLAELRRAQYGMLETRREYDKTFKLQTQEMLENMRRTDISVMELDQRRRQFNASQNLSVIQMVAELATQRANIQYQYAASDVAGGNAAGADLNQIIGQLDSMLSRTARVT